MPSSIICYTRSTLPFFLSRSLSQLLFSFIFLFRWFHFQSHFVFSDQYLSHIFIRQQNHRVEETKPKHKLVQINSGECTSLHHYGTRCTIWMCNERYIVIKHKWTMELFEFIQMQTNKVHNTSIGVVHKYTEVLWIDCVWSHALILYFCWFLVFFYFIDWWLWMAAVR